MPCVTRVRVFAFLHGSRVDGTATECSDLDVAAWWGVVPAPRWQAETRLMFLD